MSRFAVKIGNDFASDVLVEEEKKNEIKSDV
jgi:hypothetical protein